MFNSPEPNLINSDEGYSVRVLGGGKLGIIYREGLRSVKVLSDTACDPIGYIIYKNSIKRWAPPTSGEVIDAAGCQRIIDNLRRAFLHQGLTIEIDENEEFQQDVLNKLQRID